MEQVRGEAGQAPVRRAHGRQAADAGLAAVDREKALRQARAKGKAEGAADVAAVRGVVVKASVAARVVALADVGERETRQTVYDALAGNVLPSMPAVHLRAAMAE